MPAIAIRDDQRIYYRLIPGDEANPCLVFLHEGLGCGAMWEDFPDLLCAASHCPGLVYDRLGYGRSSSLIHPRTIHYLHEYALNELPFLLDAVIPGRSRILIGHSDGGSISLIYGAERSSLLKGIITEAAHVFVEPETIEGIGKAVQAWKRGKLKGLLKYHGAKTETVVRAWYETWLSDWFRWWNIEYLLPSIAAPLLVIQGKEDQYASIAQVDSIVSRSGGVASSWMVEHCAHAPHLEARQVVLNCMTDHIARMRSLGIASAALPGA